MLRSAVAEKDPLPGVDGNTVHHQAFEQVLAEVRQRRDEFDAGSHVPRDMIERFKHCLLYTSPSPRDRQKSRMPSSA